MYCLPSTHVGHRRAALRRRHPHRADFLPVCLSYARSIAPRGCSGVVVTCGSPITTSVFVTISPTPDVPGLPGLRNVHAAQRRMVADVVRRVAVRHLPHQLAAIEVDRRSMPYGGFRSAAPARSSPALATAVRRRGARARGRVGVCRLVGANGLPSASAAQQSPGPSTSRNGRPAMPGDVPDVREALSAARPAIARDGACCPPARRRRASRDRPPSRASSSPSTRRPRRACR